MYRVIIAGSRTFDNYDLLKHTLDNYLIDKPDAIVISGGARGADALGERYAKERGLKIERYPADWKKYGRAAGPIRNEQMAARGDALVAFWNGESRGTRHMIETAKRYCLDVYVVRYNE